MPDIEYIVMVRRGFTKETLAQRISEALAGIPPEDVISINYFSDGLMSPLWRRNSALIVIRASQPEAA